MAENNMNEHDLNNKQNGNEAEEKASTPECDAAKGKKQIKKLESEVRELKGLLDKASKQLDEANEKYLRMYAEYDNYRKRTSKEKDNLYSDTVCDVVKTLLPVLDNLERAAAYDNEKRDEGVAMIHRNFVEILNGMGIKEIEALGKAFDPNLHNAIMHTEDESLGENTIATVVQKGYILGDKVIRHAMVIVAN